MPNIVSNVRDLCSPALIYLIVAIILMIETMIFQDKEYDGIDPHNRKNRMNIVYVIVQITVIAFVTYILNKLCSSGYIKLSWAILIVYVFVYGFHGSIGLSLAV